MYVPLIDKVYISRNGELQLLFGYILAVISCEQCWVWVLAAEDAAAAAAAACTSMLHASLCVSADIDCLSVSQMC